MRYIGFDLGDGESAVASFEHGSGIEPMILPVCGVKSLLSAVGMLNGSIVIGEAAYTDALANGLSVRFKSRFTSDPSSYEDIVRFARGVLQDLADHDQLTSEDRFVIGCPAGWNAAARSRYKDLLVRAGFHDPTVISESRAAFLYAKYAKTVALDVDILNESALVADIGSSTLDFAYIVDGRETGVGTFGETMLGGGILDAAILRRAVERSKDREEIRRVFSECRSWYSYCEIEARHLKEEFFNRLSEDKKAPVLKKQLKIYYDSPLRLQLQLDEEEISHLINEPLPELDGKSFSESIEEALLYAFRVTADRPPRLLLLTGGASRMPFFRTVCRKTFPDAITVCCPEPEFSIAKGLAYAGWVDDNLSSFRQAISTEISNERVCEAAQKHLGEVIPNMVSALTDLLIEQDAIPMTKLWKTGEIATLDELNVRLSERAAKVLASQMTSEALSPMVTEWIERLSGDLQAMVDPICDRYEVPRKQMQLNLTAISEDEVPMNAGGLVGLSIVGGALGVIVSLIGGIICGGTGIAAIAAGPLGFLAGVVIGAVVSLLGWGVASRALMKVKLPVFLRGVNVEKRLRSEKIRRQVSESISAVLADSSSEFRQKTVQNFSASFRGYLYSIAQAAEIPIS